MKNHLVALGTVTLLACGSGCELLYAFFPQVDPEAGQDAGASSSSSSGGSSSSSQASSGSSAGSSHSGTSSSGPASSSSVQSSSAVPESSSSVAGSSSAGTSSSSSGTIVDAQRSTVTVAPSTPVLADGTTVAVVTVTVKDLQGTPLPGQEVEVRSTGSGNVLSAAPATDATGVTTVTLASTRAEIKTLTVTVNPASAPVELSAKPQVTFTFGVATKLVFTAQPQDGVAGTTLQAVDVAVMDTNDNVVADDGTTRVTLGLGAHPGDAILQGTTERSVTAGVAHFANLRLDRASATYTLVASASTLAGTYFSATFSVQSAQPVRLGFLNTTILDMSAGENVGPVRVAVLDDFGNPVTNASARVTLSLGTNPTNARLVASSTVVDSLQGVATFSFVTVQVAGGPYTLRAGATAFTSVDSGLFNIVPGPATRLVFGQEPSSTGAGVAFSPPVTVRTVDRVGNTVSATGGAVTMSRAGGDPSATLTGNSAPLVQGVATFSQLKVNRVGTGYVLSATHVPQANNPALGSADSRTFDITVGPPAALVLRRGGGQHGTVGQPLPNAIVMGVADDQGNLVANSSVTFQVTTGGGKLLSAQSGADGGYGLGAGDAGAGVSQLTLTTNSVGEAPVFLLLGDTAGTDNNGVTVLSSGLTGSGVVVTASGDAAAPATLTKVAGGDAQVGTVATALANPFVVEVKDAFGNLVPNAAVSFEVASGGGSAGPATAHTNAQGRASSTLTLGPTPGQNTVRVSVAGVAQAVLFSATGNVGGPAKLGFQATPAGVAGANLTNLRVAIQDAQGNTLGSATNAVTLTLGDAPAGGALQGTATVSAVAGVATFGSVRLDRAGQYTLKAGSGALAAATSAAFPVVPAAAHHLEFLPDPADVAAGQTFTATVVLRDAFDNLADNDPGTWVSLQLGSTHPGAAVLDPIPVASAQGVAMFQGLSFTVAGNYTLLAQADQLTAATSAVFQVIPGAPAALVFVQVPTAGVVGAPLEDVVVEVHDAHDNLVDNATNTLTLALGSKPANAALLAGSTTQVNAVAGVATFAGLGMDKAGDYTFTVASGPLTPATSGTVTLQDGAAKLAFTSVPASAPAGDALADIVVGVQDILGATWAPSTATVTLSLLSAPPGTTFPGGDTTLTTDAVAGVATFAGVSFTVAGQYRFHATSPGVQSASSAALTITGADPAALTVVAQPKNAYAARDFQVDVQALDAFDNPTAFTGSVTVLLDTNPTGATLGGTLTQNSVPATGRTSFTNLRLDKGGEGFVLLLQATGLTDAATDPLDVQDGRLVVSEFKSLGGGQFIELYNPGLQPITIEGVQFTNAAGAVGLLTTTNLAGNQLLPGAYAKGVPAGLPIPAGAQFVYSQTFALAPSGDVLRAFYGNPATEPLLDKVDFSAGRLVTAGRPGPDDLPGALDRSSQVEPGALTAEGNDNGSNWCLTFRADNTGGQTNQSCTGATLGSVLVNEVLYDALSMGANGIPDETDDGRVWVELAGPGGGHMSGLKLNVGVYAAADGGAGVADHEELLTDAPRTPVNGMLLLGDKTAAGTSSVANADLLLADIDADNDRGYVQVLNGTQVLDAVGWGSLNFEGTHAPDVLAGTALARDSTSQDTGDNELDFASAQPATPGAVNGSRMLILGITPDNTLLGATTANVEIHGEGFLDGASATFGLQPGTGCVATATKLTCTAPAGLAAAKVDVVVVNPSRGAEATAEEQAKSRSLARQSGAFQFTTVAAGAQQVSACVFLSPASLTGGAALVGAQPFLAQVAVQNVTDLTDTAVTSITGNLGYGPVGTDPRVDTRWRWVPSAPDVGWNFSQAQDQHRAQFILAPPAGTYATTFRFSTDGSQFTYCDTDGNGTGPGLSFSTAKLGTLTVQ